MNRAPGLQKILDAFCANVGISPEEQHALEVGGSHSYMCRCNTCAEHWKLVGPDPDTKMPGPFTYRELGLDPADYAYLWEDDEPPWADEEGLPCP